MAVTGLARVDRHSASTRLLRIGAVRRRGEPAILHQSTTFHAVGQHGGQQRLILTCRHSLSTPPFLALEQVSARLVRAAFFVPPLSFAPWRFDARTIHFKAKGKRLMRSHPHSCRASQTPCNEWSTGVAPPPPSNRTTHLHWHVQAMPAPVHVCPSGAVSTPFPLRP